MSEFKNWGIGQIVVFTEFYQLNGAGRKGSTSGFNINARITDYLEQMTENGLQYGYIVEDVLTTKSYFVLESDCKLAKD
ncbi:MAG: hypothetical protein FD155_3392 [Bacteroidetes bacterium]|nr:MAG: hypothetical protein FD155_3392 [Bacteroidota bacterium]